MAGRNSADLEDFLRGHYGKVRFNDRQVIDDIRIPKIVRMIGGKLEQGERLSEAVISTVNFYSSQFHVNDTSPGVPELIERVRAWWETPVAASFTPEEQAKRRESVTKRVKAIFLKVYGGSFDGDWLDVDTNGFDLDPVGYLETVADEFGVPLPPYGSNREVIEFVLARWKPKA